MQSLKREWIQRKEGDMTMNKKYDWETAEKMFMESVHTDNISLKELSERCNIPYQTVRRYAGEHDWHRKRYRVWMALKHSVIFKD